jgi:hypothetical protein
MESRLFPLGGRHVTDMAFGCHTICLRPNWLVGTQGELSFETSDKAREKKMAPDFLQDDTSFCPKSRDKM